MKRVDEAQRADWWVTLSRCVVAIRGASATLTIEERRRAAALWAAGVTPYAAAPEIVGPV